MKDVSPAAAAGPAASAGYDSITMTNPLLQKLHPYPFERMTALTKDIKPNPALRHISLGIGEPKHPAPKLIEDALVGSLKSLAAYPATAGQPKLREACAGWLERRYGLKLDAATQILPVNGSREALFALAQTVIDPGKPGATVVCPNPFYQIYEGAALLAGAETAFANSDPARNFAADWGQIDDATWARTQLLYVCSPGNPTGAVMPLSEWKTLFELSDKHGFVIASDECYSEIYFREDAPLGGLEAAAKLGRTDYKNLVILTSLSKRSNVPGMRSGFVAGCESILEKFQLYRTYHGCAMNPAVQAASAAAWNDEAHVLENRRLYREKFAAVTPLLQQALKVEEPQASFYLWAQTPVPDTEFAQALYRDYNVTLLPGSFLAREALGINPGANFVRIALVAPLAQCVEAARRIQKLVETLKK